MLLYEIADDVHWLMLTGVKHIKKNVLCAQLCTLTNATYEQTADLSLYIWYIYIYRVAHVKCYKLTLKIFVLLKNCL